MVKSSGLQFKKVDLHIHTPASKGDYLDKKATPDQIVDRAISQGLAVIAITDHNSADMVDQIKKSAKGKPLQIIPGVEILATGGEKGVHVVILFDVDKNAEHINQFLNKIGIHKVGNKRKIATELSVGSISDELLSYDKTAIIVLAHCSSSKGVSGDIKGETRKLIFKSQRENIIGAEANESDFKNKQKEKESKRVVDLFNGSNADFGNKLIGVFQSSDSHSINDIGKSYTYFKIDENITIEDIRQCLIDPETRIKQSFDYTTTIYPHINNLSINGGFLDSQTIEFHEGLNSLLGAKGSGKSLVVEFLRFVFNLQPVNESIKEDHIAKLENCLKLHSSLEARYTDASGKQFSVKRTYNPADSNPIEISDISEGVSQNFDIDKLFPILFLSQNEIIEISQDKTGESQRGFIDRFFDFYRFQEQIDTFKKDLLEVDKEFASALRSHLSATELKTKISSYHEEIEKLGRQIKNPIFEEYAKQSNIGRAIKSQVLFVDAIKETIESLKNNMDGLATPESGLKEIDATPSVKRSVDTVKKILVDTNVNLDQLLVNIETEKVSISNEFDLWTKNFQVTKDEYEKVVAGAGATQVKLNQRRSLLLNELTNLEVELGKHLVKSQKMTDISARRNKTVTKLDNVYKAYSDERKSRCAFFTSSSGGSLEVTINEQNDKSAFKENLLKLKRGSWLKDEEIEGILKLSPKDFVDNIFRYEWSSKTKLEPLSEIARISGLDLGRIKTLVNFLFDEYDYSILLALLYTSTPKDTPVIKYKIGKTFKPLEELSTGQKATSLLMIALSDGEFPIVIDQPEDSLDLRSIWDDVCKKLRGSKNNRQFILTTHNSSVAVASDTDKFSILEATATQGKVLNSGSINNREVAEEVITYLEGGITTYEKKRQKYAQSLSKGVA